MSESEENFENKDKNNSNDSNNDKDCHPADIQKYKETLLSAIDLKNRANEFFKLSDYDTAIDFCLKAKEVIEKEILEPLIKFRDSKDSDVISLLEEVNSQNKFIYSNLALFYKNKGKYEESLEHDLKIINYFDSCFDKSYVRLIMNYIALNKVENAVYHYQQMKRIFSEASMTLKYDKLFKDLMENNPNFKKALDGMIKLKSSKSSGYFGYLYYVIMIILMIAAYFLYNQDKSPAVEEVF